MYCEEYSFSEGEEKKKGGETHETKRPLHAVVYSWPSLLGESEHTAVHQVGFSF